MQALPESELREHMQSYLTSELNRGIPKILQFQVGRKAPPDDEPDIVNLIDQTAQAMCETNRYAAERLALADSMAKRAVEQLRAAEERVSKADAARVEAEAAFTQLCEQHQREYAAKLESLEWFKKEAFDRVARAENRICKAETRAIAAEQRVQRVELSFKRIEDAVKTKLLAAARELTSEIADRPAAKLKTTGSPVSATP